MKWKYILRIISAAMLLAAIIFIIYALCHPELGTAFYIGGLYFGSVAWCICYAIYLLVMVSLFVVSFVIKGKKNR